MQIGLLGPLRVMHDGVELDLGPRKQRAVIALLAMHPGRVVATERILEALWGDDGVGKERALWTYVSRLRGLLDPDRDDSATSVLRTADRGYALDITGDDHDVTRFEHLATTGARLLADDPEAAVESLTEAESLWRGEYLEDFLHEDFTQTERDRLGELRVAAAEDLADAGLRIGRAAELVAPLERWKEGHPYRERLLRLLVLALYRSGRQAEALRAYDRHRRLLRDEMGLDPSPELQRLEEQVLLHDPRLLAGERRDVARRRTATHNPFKGLRSFGEDDAASYFGRDRLVTDVIRRIEAGTRLVTLVGASGSGKSSAVRAGVVPALRKGAIEGSDEWLIAQMVPGAHPIAELEAALLRSTVDAPDSLAEQLTDRRAGVLRAVLRVLPSERHRMILVIDQLEELFTLVPDHDEQHRFLDALIPALDDARGRVVVVTTLRADFYDRVLGHPEFATRLADGIVNVVPLTPDELEAAATRPARAVGVEIEPSLIATLVADVIGQPGGLPLFQFALTELFDRRTDDQLTLETYAEMGGVKGTLARRADDLYDELGPDEQTIARQIFLRLVAVTDDDQSVRRRVHARELIGIDADVVTTQAVTDAFGRHRLLSFDTDSSTGAPTLEVAHEALLSEWPRLRDWITEARDDLRRQAVLATIMREWHQADRAPELLLTGPRLDTYSTWAATSMLRLTEPEQDFLDESVAAEARRRDDEDARLASARADDRRGRRRRAAVLLAGLAAAAIAGWFLFAGGDDRLRVGFVSFGPELSGDISLQIENGIGAARRDLDIESEHLIPISDFMTEVGALIEADPDLVVLGFNPLEAPISPGELVARFPDQRFAVVSDDFADGPNATVARYAVEEASFLVGAAAALTSQTGTVGFVGGLPIIIDPFQAGFEAGARYAVPDITVMTHTVPARVDEVFQTPELGALAAETMYRAGADVVYAAAGLTGTGVHRAAVDLSPELGRHLWAIGVDADEWLTADASTKPHLLTSALKRHDRAVTEMVAAAVDDRLEPGDFHLELANGGVGFSTSGDHLSAATLDRLATIQASIVSGDIVVPSTVTASPTLMPDVAAMIAVTWDGAACSSPTVPLPAGEVIAITAVNTADHAVVIGAFGGGLLTEYAVPAAGQRTIPIRLPQLGSMQIRCTRIGGGLGSVLSDLAEPLDFGPDPELEIELLFDGSACRGDVPTGIELGDVVGVRVTNASTEFVNAGILPMLPGTTAEQLATTAPEDWPWAPGATILGAQGVPPGGTGRSLGTVDGAAWWFVGCGVGDRGYPTGHFVIP